jgi:hypothetical protein
VIVVGLVPLPVQIPLVVMATGNPELAVAATVNVEPFVAEAGAWVVTVMVWFAFSEFTFSVNCGAGAKLGSPAWSYCTVQAPELLVMVKTGPTLLHEPAELYETGSPEDEVAATVKLVPFAAIGGALVVIVTDWAARWAFTLWMICVAGL